MQVAQYPEMGSPIVFTGDWVIYLEDPADVLLALSRLGEELTVGTEEISDWFDRVPAVHNMGVSEHYALHVPNLSAWRDSTVVDKVLTPKKGNLVNQGVVPDINRVRELLSTYFNWLEEE